MEQEIEGLQALSRAILDDAGGEATRIIAEAQERATAKKQSALTEAARVRQEILGRAHDEIERLQQQTVATARLEAQRVLLARREALIEAIFAEAARQLALARQKTGYAELLRRLVIDAVEQMGRPAECLVHVAEQDEHLFDETAESGALLESPAYREAQVCLRLGEPAAISGGVVVESADGHKRYDNSLEARLKRGQARWRAQVYQLLQGESAEPQDWRDSPDRRDRMGRL
jgi:vacuolar-type H+-ATPase subunit E/Vma4